MGAAACHRRQPAPDVTPIAAEDESLRQGEDELLAQRGMLQRERKKIADARAELVERRAQLGHDSTGQSALDDEERKLVTREGELTQQEQGVNDKLDQLLKQRAALVQKATS